MNPWPKLRNVLVFLIASATPLATAAPPPVVRVLVVVAHPDDEYCFAATTYRLSHELGAHIDQVVITDGESGFKFSGPAQRVYGYALSHAAVGKRELPKIRRHELEDSGKVLGIATHFYLHQPDGGKVDDVDQAIGGWNRTTIDAKLDAVLKAEKYDLILTLLPTPATHGHHKAASVLALDALSRLPAEERPPILGCWDEIRRRPTRLDGQVDEIRAARAFQGLAGKPETRVVEPVSFSFDREASFGPEGKLNYQIFVDWMIAAHKSQGFFQTYVLRDDTENFALYSLNSPAATDRARALFKMISPPAP